MEAWLQTIRETVDLWGGILLGVIATIYMYPVFFRAIKNIKDKKWKDAGVDVVALMMVVLLVWVGVQGIKWLVQKVIPSNVVKYDQNNFSYSNPHEIELKSGTKVHLPTA